MFRKTLFHGYCSHFKEEEIEAQSIAQVDGVDAKHVETRGSRGSKPMLSLLTPSLKGYRGVEGHGVQRHLELPWLV